MKFEFDEGEADRQTIGHYEPVICHTLEPARQIRTGRLADSRNVNSIWAAQSRGNSIRYGDTVLTHLGKTAPNNPYLNIKVSEAIIGEHNDIFKDEILSFLRLLITQSTAGKD